MSKVIAFRGGFLKKAEKIRFERSREEKRKEKSQIQNQIAKNQEDSMQKVAYLLTEHRKCVVPQSAYKAWIESGKDSSIIESYMRLSGSWSQKLQEPEFITYTYEEEDEA